MKNVTRSISLCSFALAAMACSFSVLGAKVPGGNPLTTKSELVLADGFDFKQWVPTDLSKYDPEIKVILNLPKTAKISKPKYGGVEVILSEAYNLYIRAAYYETTQGQKEFITNRTLHDIGNVVVDEPNGMVYTAQKKYREGFDDSELESHFIYFVGSGDKMFRISDEKALDNYITPGSFYTEEKALNLYEAVKASAKIK